MPTETLISADSHVFEPGDLWTERVERKYRDRVPRLVHRDEDNSDVMLFEGGQTQPLAGFGTAGNYQGRTESNITLDDVRRGGWEAPARLADMAVDGVQAEVLYPSFAMRLFAIQDADFQTACMQAYNDWLAEFCAAAPNRLLGQALIPSVDLAAGLREVRRAASLGFRGVVISGHPEQQRDYSTMLYEELWATLEDLGLPASLHLFTGPHQAHPLFLADYSVATVLVQRSLALIVFSGVLERYPGLQIVAAENEIGWLAHLLTRMDHVYLRKGPRYPKVLKSGLLPSELFKRQISCTFIDDRAGMLTLEITGSDILMWSSDYPHNDSTWPESQEVIDRILRGVPRADRRKIVRDNAARLYHLN